MINIIMGRPQKAKWVVGATSSGHTNLSCLELPHYF